MKPIGADMKFVDGKTPIGGGPLSTLDKLAELGFQGILVRTLDEAFPTLDAAEITQFARAAEAKGMFVRAGLGKVNPYMTAELPRVRDLGEGSYLAGMERMIGICAAHGWTEAWTATGGYKRDLPPPFCFDRFRTDVTWSAQLEATAKFLDKLAPTLRREGVRLNIETHEEITTYEILRLIDRIGDDVLGVCLDPGNLPVRGEAFLPAIARVAPHTHITHLRDAALLRTDGGLARYLAPVGQGHVDWPVALDILLSASPDAALIVEAPNVPAIMMAATQDPDWRAAHPDLDEGEIAIIESMADVGDDTMFMRRRADPHSGRPADGTPDFQIDFMTASLAALRTHLSELSLHQG